MDKTYVGRKLRLLRDQTDYSVEEIAYKCDISTQEYKDIEIGKRYPSDTSLNILLELYGITEEDFHRRDFVDHERRKSMIWYAQLVLSLLLILGYFLPFSKYFNRTGFASGFDVLRRHTDVAITFVFAFLVVQFFAHLVMYFNKGRMSNTFKGLFVLINLLSMIILSLIFFGDGLILFTLAVMDTFFALHLGITIYDLAKYPVEHDYLQDKGRNRLMIVFFMSVVYILMYVIALIAIIGDGSNPMLAESIVFLVVGGLYILSFIVIRKSNFKERLYSTIYLAFPPIAFTLFYIAVMWGNSFVDWGTLIWSLLMLIPVFVINIDVIINEIRRFVQKFLSEG